MRMSTHLGSHSGCFESHERVLQRSLLLSQGAREAAGADDASYHVLRGTPSKP